MSNPDSIVETQGLGHSYGDRVALDAIDLSLRRGEVFALLGPNGGGKSTLFRILTTAMVPSRGRASILGHDVVAEPHEVRRRIGVAFQSPSLDPKLTVRENLLHQGHLYGWRGSRLSTRISELGELLGLQDRLHDKTETLSGGLARRVDLAKALLHEPPVLLLDEPSTGLDPGARDDLLAALENRRDAQGTTALLTTHLMEEAERCDRVAILDCGRLVACATPAELVREIGGDVITLEAEHASALADEMGAHYGGSSVSADGAQVRMEHEDGGAELPEILSRWGGQVRSVTVARPTLADVFLHRTGHRFDTEDAE